MRGATGVTLQPHQILCLPRKMTINPRHIWNVIYIACSNRHHPPASPNIAPATKNDFHDWSSSHMKRHLQCAKQQASPSNLTKYCACHGKLFQNRREICRKRLMRHLQWRPIRPWSDHELALRRRILHGKLQHFALWLSTQISRDIAPATRSDIPRSPNAVPAKKSHSTTCGTNDMECHLQFTMRGAAGVTLQPHLIFCLPRKMTPMIDPPHIWTVIYNARGNRTYPPTSPNTAHSKV